MDDNGSEEPIDTDTTELDLVKQTIRKAADDDPEIPLREDWEERVEEMWPSIHDKLGDPNPERIKHFERFIAGEGDVKGMMPLSAASQRPRPIVKPEYRDRPEDEEVGVSIRTTREPDGTHRVTSDAFLEDGYIDTAALPLPIQVGMAVRSPKPDGVRPIMVPEARIEMVEVAIQIEGLEFDHPDYSSKSMHWIADTLLGADLYWVSAEMCQLLQQASPVLPPTTLTPDLLPSESGVVFFAEPLMGQDSQVIDQQVWVSALAWGPCEFDVVDTTRVEGAVVGDYEADTPPPDAMSRNPSMVVNKSDIDEGFVERHGLQPGETVHFKGNGTSIATWRKWERWMPLGRTDWPNGFDTEGEFAPPNFTPTQLASIVEDRRWLAAFAILSQQTSITRIRITDTDRHAAKRLKRRKLPAPKVRLVDINPPKHVTTGETREVHWTKRWLVRGHWRQQAYGPGRQYRRPVYINSFVKGPENMPLEVSPEVVKVWRR